MYGWNLFPANRTSISGFSGLLLVFKVKRFRAVARVTFVKAKVTKTIRDGRYAGDDGAVTGSLRTGAQSGTAPKLAALRCTQTWVPLRPLWTPVLGLLNAAQDQEKKAETQEQSAKSKVPRAKNQEPRTMLAIGSYQITRNHLHP